MEREVQVSLEFNAETKKAQQNLDALNKRMLDIRESADKAEEGFRTMSDVSAGAAAAGALLFAPAVLSANQYIAAVGKGEAISRRWLAAQERQQKAQQELGRKSAQALMPYYELLADITEKISEVDPRLIQAGVAVGGALALVGAAGMIASQIGIFAAAVVKLGTYIAAHSAIMARAGVPGGVGSLAGGGAVLAGAGVAGVGIGIGLVRGIGRARGDERQANYGLSDAAETLGQALIVIAAKFLEALGGAAKTVVTLAATFELAKIKVEMELTNLADIFNRFGVNVEQVIEAIKDPVKAAANLLGLENTVTGTLRRGSDTVAREATPQERADQITRDLEATTAEIDNSIRGLQQGLLDLAGITDDAETAVSQFSDETLDLFDQLQQAQRDAEQEYNQERIATTTQYNQENLKLEEEYNRQRQQQLEDFQKQQQQTEDDFNLQRSRAQQQNEQRLRDLQQQAQQADSEALAGYLEETRSVQAEYQQSELKAQQDYGRKREKAERDLRERLVDAAARLDATSVFSILRDANKQQRDDSEQFGTDRSDAKRQLNDRLQDIRQQYDTEKAARQRQTQQAIQEQQRQFADSQRLAVEDFQRKQELDRARFQDQQQREQEAYQRQRAQRQADYNNQMVELQNKYTREKTLRQQQFVDAYNQMNQFGEYEAQARRAHYQRLEAELQSFLNANSGTRQTATQRSTSTQGQRAIAQYAEGTDRVPRTGLYMLHEDERVLNPRDNRRFNALGLDKVMAGMQSVTNRNTQVGSIAVTVNGAPNMSPSEFAQLFRRELTVTLAAYNSGGS